MWSEVQIDIRFALRLAARNKLLSAAIICSVALGIASTSALFSVVDQVLLRELPVREPERVVWMRTLDARSDAPRRGANPGDIYDWRERNRTFEAIGWFNEAETTVRVDDAEPARVGMALVSPEFARAIGIEPMLGRMFSAEHYPASGTAPGVIVSQRLWRTQLNVDSNVIGRTVLLNNVAHPVIGVLPKIADDLPMAGIDVWRPLIDNLQQRTQPRTASYMVAVGRLAHYATLATAQADMDRISQQLAIEHPTTNATRKVVLEPLSDGVAGTAGPMLMLIGGTVLTLLLVACANIGNLLLSQSTNRTREIAVRMAIGGSRARLMQQLATESVLLCGVGGVLGLLLAPMLIRVFVRLYPGILPRGSDVTIDWRVVVVSLAAIAVTAALAAIPLTRQLLHTDPSNALGNGTRATMSRKQRRIAGSLVTAQLAVTMVLLVGGWLLMQTYVSLARTDNGFVAEELLTFEVTPSRSRYPTGDAVLQFYAQLHGKLRAIAGVNAVGFTNLVPFTTRNWSEYYEREGRNDVMPNMPLAKMQMVNHELIDAFGLTLLRGRKLDSTDRFGSANVVVVNAALADAHFPGEDAVGKRINMRGALREIVGVVSNKRHTSLHQPAEPEVFVPIGQMPLQLGSWGVVRASGGPAALTNAVRSAVREIDATVPVAHLSTMTDLRASSIAAEKFRAVMMAAFALFAATLATIGLYAVVADGVQRRTREIGLRMALGQSQSSVRASVLLQAARLAVLGIVTGGAASIVVSLLLEQFVTEAVAGRALIVSCTGAAMFGVFLLAAMLPARRASGIEPMQALRSE